MQSEEKNQLKPFIKWVGGKTQVLDIINILKPETINKFIEPFVGGGAVFFNFAYPNAIINDINKELITTYKVIKNNLKELKLLLNKWNNFNNLKDFYEELRTKDVSCLDDLSIAARLIFLNKYCFNGLYRVNSKGQFNVPFGKKSKINIYDNKNLINISKYLNDNKIVILNENYEKLLDNIEESDFLFVDPPYYFEDNKGFNAYDSNKFTLNDQEKLYNFLVKAEKKGAKWLLTNNDNPTIRNLYKKYNFFSKRTNRFINSNAKKRIDAAQELFIYNYEISSDTKVELEFITFTETFIETNITLKNIVDWDKVEENISSYEYDISIFNFLCSKNESILKQKLEQYWDKHLSSFEKLYILLAIREGNTFLHNKDNPFFKNFMFENADNVLTFLKTSNLIKLFIGNEYIDFRTYMRGVEVGLDSNARKNRYGKIMENNIAQILSDNNIEFKRNVPVSVVKNLPPLQNQKYFDFVFTKNNKTYYLECNFYNTSGSKLNEIVRSFINLNKKLKSQNLDFIWITDGAGWKQTKSSLKTAFKEIKNLFSIKLFREWIKTI